MQGIRIGTGQRSIDPPIVLPMQGRATGLAQILAGFPFPADCQTTIDPACHARDLAGEVSWRHEAHGWPYFLGAIALQLSVFAMAWRGGQPGCGLDEGLGSAGDQPALPGHQARSPQR
jgi:hypothetical protein